MSEVMFCKDCEHYLEQFAITFDRCMRGIKSKDYICLVTGKTEQTTTGYSKCCHSERNSPHDGYCGKEAKYFRPKEVVND